MKQNPILGAAAGAAGGLLGAWMMLRFNRAVARLQAAEEDRNRRSAYHSRDAYPNDVDATTPDEPGTMQAASALAETATGEPLGERGRELAAPVLHYAFGAFTGGVYGAAAEWNRAAAAGFGLPFGATVWLLADELGMTVAGLAENPTAYPISRHAAALGSHLVYGLTVEGVRRALRHDADRLGTSERVVDRTCHL